MLDQYADRRALVTGASSGLGRAFARELAARGMHPILVARRGRRLHELASELHQKHGSRCEVLPADLSDPAEVARVADAALDDGAGVELLVNSAGFGVVDDVPHTDRDRVLTMLDVNCRALTDLTYRFLPPMLARGHGAVLNVASVAAFTPVAYMSGYAATKAYVLHFSEGLWAEARDRGVTVTAACPGPTKTEFFDLAGVSGWLRKARAADPEKVARRSLRQMEKGRLVAFGGFRERMQSLAIRLAPRRVCVLESRKYFRPKSEPKPEAKTLPVSPPGTDAGPGRDGESVRKAG